MDIQRVSINKNMLKEEMKKVGINTLEELSKKAGINYNTLRVILSTPNVYTNMDILQRIVRIVGTDNWINIETFQLKSIKKGLK